MMRLRPRLGTYILALHVPLFGCAALLLPARPLLFVGAEGLLLASLGLGWWLVRQALEPLGYTRRFTGTIERWSYDPPDDTATAAARIKPLLEARLAAQRVTLPMREASR